METTMLPSPPRLLDQVRDRIRLKHYSIRTALVRHCCRLYVIGANLTVLIF